MGRAPCCSKVGLNRGPWTPEEDMLLSKHIEAQGEGNWRALPKSAGLLRCGKSCRLRWVNYLRPNVKRGNISEDEEDLIIMLHALLGNRWSLIAARMPGRTDNEIKNYWNTHLSKKLASRGLDPKTHKPIISSKSQKKAEEESSVEAPQQAWETTMDMDTRSYSTGSCDEHDPTHWNRYHHRSLKHQKVQSSQDFKTKPNPAKSHSEQQKHNKFDCPSPSSVLNAHSPTPSASNTSGSNSSSSSDHSFSSAIHEDDRSPAASEAEPTTQTMGLNQLHASDTHHMLEFFDEFLSREPQAGAVPELFKEDGGSEFWDSLGKIELPECSPVCQSDLWDGLTDFLPSQAAAPSQQFPSSTDNSLNSIHQSSEAAQIPLLISSPAPCGAHFMQDSISELLFCS